MKPKPYSSYINPYRILWHISSGIALVAYMLWTEPSKKIPLIVLSLFTLAFFLVDILRSTSDTGESLFRRCARLITSEKEASGPNASFYYSLSLLFTVLLFQPRIAMGAIICLAVGDPVAGVIGRLSGRIRIGNKSIEGAAANFTACFFIIRHLTGSNTVSLAGAFTGALMELVHIPKVDDNLIIPLTSGLAMTIAAALSS